MVVNSCLKDLEGRMIFKRMWNLVTQARKRGTNECRGAVTQDLCILTRSWLMIDRVCSAEI